ncbi:Protein CBG03999 [Caenorhabditis briggsae]|uniref:Protein CBG03999 n=1 Tax=Caenorhabditis briggsae TaxID=6238 RepID=A8WVY5_CAEBR|nr:Protein CBG03999 [Caenorhabditis briggsae]CAP24797.2 Protein CBG03999 [Caenorhabditis briggsae]
MTANQNLYSGFFLKCLPDNENGEHLIRVACFKPGTTFRKVLELTTNVSCERKFGEIVHFWSLDGEMTDKSHIKFKDDQPPLFQHETAAVNEIVHLIQNHQVNIQDIRPLNVLWHSFLGEINCDRFPPSPARYMFLLIQVNVKKDTFEIELMGGREEDLKQKKSLDITLEQQIANYPEVLKIENDHTCQSENSAWKEIGFFELKKFSDKELTGGIRVIFRLCDSKGLISLKRRRQAYPAKIIKQRINGNEFEDDPNYSIESGSLFEREKKNKIIEEEVVCKLKSESRASFERNFKAGDVFRFESEQNPSNVEFWQKQLQKMMPLYNLTIDDAPESLQVQDILDNHQVEAEKLRKLTDKGFPPMNLNPSQLLAIRMAMNEDRPLVCIQGPPGTGKSHTLSYLLFRIMRSKKQAVVLTPTREALKNLKQMTEKLLKEREQEFQVHEHALMDIKTYHKLIDASDEAKSAIEQIRSIREDAQMGEIAHEDYSESSRRLEKAVCSEVGREILKNVRVVFSTIESSFVTEVMKVQSFQPAMCLVDEAAQVMECQTWPAVLKMKKLVLAGDPKQLPALVKTKLGRDLKLNQSVMERLMLKKENYSWVMLNTQYRSHEEITHWSNSCFYDCHLKSSTKDEKKLVDELNPKPSFTGLYEPMVHIDTSGVKTDPERALTYEQRVTLVTDGEKEYSYSNIGEATYAMQHYKNLLDMGVKPENIALISPYRGQIELLGRMIDEYCKTSNNMDCKNTKIGTVDSVQGQEYDVVIFTSVRNNPKKNFGFVSDVRRLNVVVTRAKRHFVLIGSGYMFKHNHISEYHPQLESTIPSSSSNRRVPGLDLEPRNNFGFNFENFMKNSEDTDMIAWCEEWIRNGKDPLRAQTDDWKLKKLRDELRSQLYRSLNDENS